MAGFDPAAQRKELLKDFLFDSYYMSQINSLL